MCLNYATNTRVYTFLKLSISDEERCDCVVEWPVDDSWLTDGWIGNVEFSSSLVIKRQLNTELLATW